MNLEIYSLFFFVFAFPGLIARRFYYSKEFSKQFTPKNFVVSLFYSFILGIGIIYISSVLYNILIPKFTGWSKINSNLISNLYTTYCGKNAISLVKLLFNDTFLLKIVILGLITISFSIVIALVTYNFIRILRLDKKISFLRFSNHWFYYFRGEFLHFSEFKEKESKISKKKFFVYADILTDTANSGTLLYSGVVKQYELNKDTNDLETIYLSEVLRWKKDGTAKEVHSDCLIIPYKNVLNINLNTIIQEKIQTENSKNTNFKILTFTRANYDRIEPIILLFFFCIPFFDFFNIIKNNFAHVITAKILIALFVFMLPKLGYNLIYDRKKINPLFVFLALFLILLMYYGIYKLLDCIYGWIN